MTTPPVPPVPDDLPRQHLEELFATAAQVEGEELGKLTIMDLYAGVEGQQGAELHTAEDQPGLPHESPSA